MSSFKTIHEEEADSIQRTLHDEITRLRAELAAKSKDADALQAVVTSIQEYAASLEYTGKWANADDDDSCRHNIAREIQELMGEGNDPAKA